MRPFRRKINQNPKGVYAFIDSQNLNLGTQKMGWKMDWSKLYQYLQKEHGVTRAYLFIGYMSEHEEMYNTLHELGYLVVLKPTVVMNDSPQTSEPTGQVKQSADSKNHNHKDQPEVAKRAVKGNVDAELVLYAMKEMPNYSKAIIVSGDGDFYCLAEYLASKDRLKHIMTPNRFYSSLLKPYEKYIIRIDEMRRELAYKDYKRKGAR